MQGKDQVPTLHVRRNAGKNGARWYSFKAGMLARLPAFTREVRLDPAPSLQVSSDELPGGYVSVSDLKGLEREDEWITVWANAPGPKPLFP